MISYNFCRRILHIIISVLLIMPILLSSAEVSVYAADEPAQSELYSQSCALMDGYSGRILYKKNSTEAMANASTTKILTCILALEYGELSDTVTASAYAASQPKVHLGMTEGQEFVLEDLLYALMLESYNDCAVAIAEHISGSVEEFAALMNEKALAIGCQDTYFITPNGLDASDAEGFHHTTAEDLCLIMRYCAWESPQSEAFLTITQTQSFQFVDSGGTSYSVSNHNSLLTTMDGALTGKTGFTANAGYCYVMAYEKDGKRFCAALLACGWPNNKTYKWQDAAKLMEYASEAYDAEDIYKEPELPVITIDKSCRSDAVLSEWQSSISFTPIMANEGDIELVYMIAEADEVQYEISFVPSVKAPLEEGEAIGSYCISVNGVIVREYALLSAKAAYQWDFYRLFSAIWNSFLF